MSIENLADTIRGMGDWVEESRCAPDTAFLFHASANGWAAAQRTHEAKRICRRCPVQAECLEYALKCRIRVGVWGGLSAKERDEILQERPKPPRRPQFTCGTPSGYKGHYRAREVPCGECRRAMTVQRAEQRLKQREGK